MTKLSDTQRVILSRAAQHEALLATPPAKLPAAARQAVLRSMITKGLLAEGTTIAEIMEATGWQPHTVRGFLAGLKRKGVTVEVLERVRQVGPNKQGAKGSYSIYRIAEAR
jgi:hypothetical protein